MAKKNKRESEEQEEEDGVDPAPEVKTQAEIKQPDPKVITKSTKSKHRVWMH